ncbi:MAG: hypothetical protein U0S12_01840 [Fimbriimonadales bacterium]
MKWSILALASVCSGCGFVHNVLGEMGGASVSVNGNTIQVRVKGVIIEDAEKVSRQLFDPEGRLDFTELN